MTIGLEEDSRFYDGPIIDTRADVNATEKEESVVEKEKREIVVQEAAVTQEKKVIEAKEEVVQTQETSQEDETKEGETTFSYERDDE